ncbi:MAG TPA: hypothetical protein VMF30_05975, partial [Pirellulales bacterium]|nr:hypothetical protein [Pirellulales bacterium]
MPLPWAAARVLLVGLALLIAATAEMRRAVAADDEPDDAAAGIDAPDAASPKPVGAEAADPPSWLNLSGGSHVSGRLIDSPAGGELFWQAAGFAGPFSVPRAITQEIQVSAAPVPAVPNGTYCFLLAHRTRLAGELKSFGERTAVIEVAGIGQLEVDRDALYHMSRTVGRDSPTLVFD